MGRGESALVKVTSPELPEEWESVPFEQVIADSISGDWGKEEASADFPIRTTVLRGTDFVEAQRGRIDGAPVRFVKSRSAEKRAVRYGDLLIELSGGSKDQPSGRVLLTTDSLAHANPTVTFTNFVRRLRVDASEADPEFAFYFWLHLYRAGRTRAYERRTTNIRNFKLRDFLQNEYLNLPPVDEQRAIVGVLRSIQQAKGATEKVIAATRELKRSATHHLFKYGPVPISQAGDVSLVESDLGEIPAEWTFAPLKEVANIGYGVQAAVAHLKDPSKGTPILTNVNISTEGTIDLGTIRYYEIPLAKRERFLLQKGDVLFNWRSGSQQHVGKTALFTLDGEYTHSSFILRIRCSDRIRPEFLARYLHLLRTRGFFVRNRQQSSVNSVFNKSISETIPVLLPPLEVQDAITNQLSAIDRKIKAEEEQRASQDSTFRSLLNELMTGKRRVNSTEVA